MWSDVFNKRLSLMMNTLMTTLPAGLRRIACLGAGALTLALGISSCSNSISGTGSTYVSESPDSIAVLDTFRTSATVLSINQQSRRVGLRMEDGKQRTVKIGKEAVNFDQIRVNDRVDLAIAEEYIIALGDGVPSSAARAAVVELAPVGAKPGGVAVDTAQVVAKVRSVDPATRAVVLELPDGSTETATAGGQVDLSQVTPGKSVTLQHTIAMVLAVSA